MNIWQPIETAPKDGAPLLLWWDSKPVISYYAERVGFKGWQPPSMMPIKVGGRSAWNPTHWMPLPSSPSDPAQEPEAVAWQMQVDGKWWAEDFYTDAESQVLVKVTRQLRRPLYARPDEIAALADELVGIQEELAIEEWRDALGKAAHHLRRLAATSPGDAMRKVLRAHWLHQIVCNHEDGTDKPCCSCSMWNCPPQPSIGAAVEAWIDHVIQQLPVCGDTNLEVQRLLRKISDLAYDENASEPLDDAINYANKALAALAPAKKAGDATFDKLFNYRSVFGATLREMILDYHEGNVSDGRAAKLTEEYIRSIYAKFAATPTPPSADVVSFPRWWVQKLHDDLNNMSPMPSGPHGDYFFLLTEIIKDKLSAAHGGGTDATWYRSGPVFGTYERITPSDPAQEPEAVAWVIHGDDNARSDGSLDAMAWQEGEFTRPLYAKPQASPASLDREAVARAIKNGVYFDGDDREVKGFDDAADNVLALIEGRT